MDNYNPVGWHMLDETQAGAAPDPADVDALLDAPLYAGELGDLTPAGARIADAPRLTVAALDPAAKGFVPQTHGQLVQELAQARGQRDRAESRLARAWACLARVERELRRGMDEGQRGVACASAWDDVRRALWELEEAGCTDTEMLGHLRSEREHVRGCWALDLILGKD